MVKLNVEGMSCGGCVSSVTRIIRKTIEVEESKVTVELEAKVATIDAELADDQVSLLIEKIGKAGFTATR